MSIGIVSLRKIALAGAIAAAAASASATVIFDTWTNNGGAQANVTVSVTKVGNEFNWSLTINPWNAEALGLFVDLGDVNMPASVPITNATTSPTTGGLITLIAKDTTSDSCGTGCNLNGAPTEPVAIPDGEWELVFRLGDSGFQGYQTFLWTTPDLGLDESSFASALMAYRTQVNCPAGSTLPSSTDCEGSQKGFGGANGNGNGNGNGGGSGGSAPEPATLALVGLGLLGAAVVRRRQRN